MNTKELFQKILKNKKDSLFIVLFDALFLFCTYLFVQGFNLILPSQSTFNFLPLFGAVLALILGILYILILVFIYSFFKYLVLQKIKHTLKRQKIDFLRLFKFFRLNLLFALLFVVVGIIISQIATVFGDIFGAVFALIIIIPIYFAFNLIHSEFILEKKYKLFSSLFDCFKFKKYRILYLSNLFFLGAFFLFFFAVGSLVAWLVKSFYVDVSWYTNYTIIFTSVAYVFMYFLVFLNRFCFVYLQLDKEKLNQKIIASKSQNKKSK